MRLKILPEMMLHVELFRFAMQGDFGFWCWLVETRKYKGCIPECALSTCLTRCFLRFKLGRP